MNINRHNYEEFFILYMDNELSSDDRRLVEAFVQKHPDLKEELDVLLQYKLTPDTGIVFSGKEELLKINGEAPITLTNYDEWLSLYIDNELTPAQRSAVEDFAAGNILAQQELELLQRTKLQPEEIIFTDKASLYRKEEKVRPLYFQWWKVAAILIILLGLTTLFIVNKKGTQGGDIAEKGNGPGKIIAPEKSPSQNSTSNQVAEIKEDIADQNNQATNSAITNDKRNTNSITPSNKQDINPVAIKNRPQDKNDNNADNIKIPLKDNAPVMVDNNKTNNNPTNDLSKPLNNPNVINPKELKNPIALNSSSNNDIQKNILTNNNVTNLTGSPSDIRTASLTDQKDNDPETGSDGKKGKLRGFFRKVTRTFEKRTNIDPTDGENRLLVAGLSFKMK